MSIKSNIIKGYITSGIGTIILLMTVFFLFTKQIFFIWEGIAGLTMGTILLMAPRTIEKKTSELIKAWGSKSPTSSNIAEVDIEDELKKTKE